MFKCYIMAAWKPSAMHPPVASPNAVVPNTSISTHGLSGTVHSVEHVYSSVGQTPLPYASYPMLLGHIHTVECLLLTILYNQNILRTMECLLLLAPSQVDPFTSCDWSPVWLVVAPRRYCAPFGCPPKARSHELLLYSSAGEAEPLFRALLDGCRVSREGGGCLVRPGHSLLHTCRSRV